MLPTPLQRLVSSLQDDDDLVPAIVDEVRRRVAELADLPVEQVRMHVGALVAAGLSAAADQRPAAAAELDLAAALAVTRAEQGVPVVALLAGLHVGHQHVWQRARERAAALGVGTDVVLDAVQQHGEWSESIRAATIEAHRRTEVSHARSRADRQTALVNALVVTGAGSAEVEALRAHGLDPAALWLRRERARSSDGPRRPTRTHEVGGRVGPDVVTLLARPATDPTDRPAALVGPFRVEQAPSQHALAGRLLDAALAGGPAGDLGDDPAGDRAAVVTVADLAVDLAIGALPEAGPALAAALLPRLSPASAADRMLVATLAAWLEHGQRLAETAAALFVHPNTVRHRLGRLRRRGVGVDVVGVRAATSLWWACRAWARPQG